MQIEYNRLQFVQNILRKLSPSYYDSGNYISGNLEIWIMYAIEQAGINFFEEGKFYFEHLKNLFDITYMDFTDVENIINFFHKNYLLQDRTNLYKPLIEKSANKWIFSYSLFNYEMEAERAAVLSKMGTAEQIMQMILRYSAIMVRGSNHWALPPSVYKNFIKFYKIEIEGFASPLNSQLLLLAPNKKNIYCSLFPDTDAAFGSMGSFFGQNFDGKRLLINPPFIFEIIEAVLEKIEKSLSRDNSGIFVVCIPEWPDKDTYKKLLNSKFLLFHRIFLKNKHHYIHEGKIIKSMFNTTFFMFSGQKQENYFDKIFD